jgi:hypothetical protein
MQQNQSLRTNENLVKISLKTDLRKILAYVQYLLKKKELDFVVLSGLDRAIKRVIVVAEIMKVKMPNLHQVNVIDHVIFKNNEGEVFLPKMEITLSHLEPAIKTYGYQAPYTNDQLKNIKVCKMEGKSKEDKANKSFQLKRYSFYKKKSKIFFQNGKKPKGRKSTTHSSIDYKNSSTNTSIGTPISNRQSVNKVFYLKI